MYTIKSHHAIYMHYCNFIIIACMIIDENECYYSVATYSLNHLLTIHSFPHSLTYSLTHLLTH